MSSLVPSHPLPVPVRGAPAGRSLAPVRRARLRGWDPLLFCLAAYLLSGVGRLHQLFSPLGAVKLLLVCSLGALLFYAMDRSAVRKLGPVLRAPTTRWVLAFLFWAGVSVLTALRPGPSLASYLDSLPKTVAMYVLIVAAARDWRDVERLCWIYFLSVVIYAAVVLVRFQVTADKWRLGSLYYYDSNDFATLAVTALPFGLYFAVAAAGTLRRAIAIVGSGCVVIAFVWSGSRGGLLALGAVGMFLLLRYRAIHPAWRLAATGVAFFLLLATASDAYWKKMSSILAPSSDYNLTGSWGRLAIWERGLGYMARFPLAGVGYDNFPVAEGTLFRMAAELQARGKGAKWGVAHNSFIQAGAELGVPGLIMYIGILVSALLAARSIRAIPGGPRAPPRLAQSLMASLIGFIVGSFFLTLAYSDMVFALAALTAALAKTTRIGRVPSPRRYA